MGLLASRCKRCGGNLEEITYVDGDTEAKCLQCARVDNLVVPEFVLREIKAKSRRGFHIKRER